MHKDPGGRIKGRREDGEKTKRGKGTKPLAQADASELPLTVCPARASPHEVPLVEATLAAGFIDEIPERLIGDQAYDSDPLDAVLREKGIEVIAPHRRNRRKPRIQDGHKLRRHKRSWKIERLFAQLRNFPTADGVLRARAENYLGFIRLRCIVILC